MSSELDRFRQEWQQEVQARGSSDRQASSHDANSAERRITGRTANTGRLTGPEIDTPNQTTIHSDEFFRAHKPKSNVMHNHTLTKTDREAIGLFETAVDMEHNGQMSDAVKYYRLAFKSNERVDKLYREMYFSKPRPAPAFAPADQQVNMSGAELDVSVAGQLGDLCITQTEATDKGDAESVLLNLPTEVIALILETLALDDLGSFTQATYSCRRLATTGYSNVRMWRRLCAQAFDYQHYDAEFDVDSYVAGFRSWQDMYKNRPRVQFNGVYISTCNYLRPGLAQTWNNPLHMVTYYRYVRFYEDGTCMNLLTTLAPADVVPVFRRQEVGVDETDTQVVPVYKKDDGTVLTRPKGITQGTWKIMTAQGRLFIESEGSVDRYIFFMEFDIRSSGKHRHNKLKWREFWSLNKITQDTAEFSLKNDKAYYFVRSRF